ncbi:MAG TPA: 50S ribosomal protein L34 [Candidatus Ratteibacteria bacterium]|nr:50S ribosomal protein L34 [bacterium]HRS06633.1 50S ribosomal protein L34 [Candidatus Ratteibacteria bacterium]HON06363.1 50S ribosomal protein L34 [bacterium]HOQ82230.1 50S ribosomal protein L34 [bacterium]HPC29162.1 50S ribosomal protein L34 [bacterium]
MMSITLKPNNLRRKKVHGFRKRMSNHSGKKIFSRRRKKGRHLISI